MNLNRRIIVAAECHNDILKVIVGDKKGENGTKNTHAGPIRKGKLSRLPLLDFCKRGSGQKAGGKLGCRQSVHFIISISADGDLNEAEKKGSFLAGKSCVAFWRRGTVCARRKEGAGGEIHIEDKPGSDAAL